MVSFLKNVFGINKKSRPGSVEIPAPAPSSNNTLNLDLHVPVNYTFGDFLGDGAFGCVYQVKIDGDDFYALKVIELQRLSFQGREKTIPLSTDETKQYARREIKCLRRLDHPNILRYYADFEIESKDLLHWNSRPERFPTTFPLICMLSDLCQASLRDILLPILPDDQRQLPELNMDNKKKFLMEIISALKHIHALDIMHRDVKPENILLKFNPVEETWSTKLGDFGLSKFYVPDQSVTKDPGGSGCYRSIEQASEDEDYTKKTDVYSFSVICYEFYCTTWTSEEDLKPKKEQLEKLADIHKIIDEKGLSLISVDFNFQALDDPLVELIVLMLCKEKPLRPGSEWFRPSSARVEERLKDFFRI